MNHELIARLRCPKSRQLLTLVTDKDGSEWLCTSGDQQRYPVRNGIPRFVPESNYADNFGMQWNQFAKTQLDSHSGQPISADRFWKATGWNMTEMRDKWVLDVGCGSGRFAEVALSTGAHVVALDYSSAVDACWANLKHYSRLHVVQGDIYALPFAPDTFDYVYSLGVLQHTPDVAKAFAALPPMLLGGGRICVDYYEKSFKTYLHPKTWLRPITRRMNKHQLFSMVKAAIPVLLPISRNLARLPNSIGVILRRLIPVANYEGVYPLSEIQLYEWALLDTFDWLSPVYDNPQTRATVYKWAEQAALCDVQVLRAGHLVVRGLKEKEGSK